MNDSNHGSRDALAAALIGAAVGRMISPGVSKEDLAAATPSQRAAVAKDLRQGRTVAWVAIIVIVLGVLLLLFAH